MKKFLTIMMAALLSASVASVGLAEQGGMAGGQGAASGSEHSGKATKKHKKKGGAKKSKSHKSGEQATTTK